MPMVAAVIAGFAVQSNFVEGFDSGESGFLHAACAAAFVAYVEFDGECFGEECWVGQFASDGGLAEIGDAGGETGQVQFAACVGGSLDIGDGCGGHSGFLFSRAS
jgi:hypothetical protein